MNADKPMQTDPILVRQGYNDLDLWMVWDGTGRWRYWFGGVNWKQEPNPSGWVRKPRSRPDEAAATVLRVALRELRREIRPLRTQLKERESLLKALEVSP